MEIARSFATVGLLVSLYAIGVAIGEPILTALTSRFPRKPLLISIVLLFIIGNIFATLAPGFITLVIARVLTGFAHGIYFSIGSTIAASLVKEEKRATAISIMFAGLTLAIVTGVPLGTFIGQHFGWRATFVGVSILGIIGLISSVMLLPNTLKNAKGIALTAQLKVLTNKKLILAFLMTAMGYGGTFVVFTYLSPILQEITGLQESTVTVILLIYGIAIAIGNLVGGKIANKAPLKALFWMFIIQALVLFVFYFTVSNTVLSIITLFLIGLLSFATVPGLQLLVVQIAEKELPGTEDVASAINIAAFNIGIAIGSYAGGLVVTSSLGLQNTPWIGTLFLIGAILLTFYSIRLNRGR